MAGLFEETPAQKRRDAARNAVGTAVWRICEAAGTADGAELDGWSQVRDIFPGAEMTRRFPVPHYNLPASLDVLFAARVQLREAIADARGHGNMSWADIANQLGLRDRADAVDMTLSRAGWRLAAMGVLPDEPDRLGRYAREYGPRADWRCWTCGGHVHESDPEHGIREAQSGHKDDCTRLAAELAAEQDAWDAAWNSEVD